MRFFGSRKNWIVFLSCFIFLAVVANFIFLDFLFSRGKVNSDHFEALRQIRALNGSGADKAVIFGSSMSREGIDQKYLGGKFLQLEFYNLSVSSGKPTDFYLMYHSVRDKSKIKLAVIALSPWQFEKKYTGEICQDIGTKTFFNYPAMSRIYGRGNSDRRCLAKMAVVNLWGYYKFGDFFRQAANNEIRDLLKPVSGRDSFAGWRQFQYAQDKPEIYFEQELAKEKNRREYSNSNFEWSTEKNIQMKALSRLVFDLNKDSIPFFIVTMPVNPRMARLYEAGVVKNYRDSLDREIPAGAGYDFLFSRTKEEFIDFDHLNSKGRQFFTEDISRIISNNYAF